MTPEQKQSELQRHRAILFATFDYLMERNAGSFVTDDYDPIVHTFEQEKERTENNFRQGKLNLLQQQLQRRIDSFRDRADLQYSLYIQEKTGYNIDIFLELRSRVQDIVSQKQIHTEEESRAVGLMLRIYEQTGEDPQQEALLKSLRKEYYDRTYAARKSLWEQNADRTEVIKRVVKGDVEEVTIRVSSGPKPAHLQEQEAVSPDGRRRVCVTQWSDGQYASTYVSVSFPAANGAVFGSNGINPDVKAYWKDNNTLIIEFRKEYAVNLKCQKVKSFDDVVTIEYIEH